MIGKYIPNFSCNSLLHDSAQNRKSEQFQLKFDNTHMEKDKNKRCSTTYWFLCVLKSLTVAPSILPTGIKFPGFCSSSLQKSRHTYYVISQKDSTYVTGLCMRNKHTESKLKFWNSSIFFSIFAKTKGEYFRTGLSSKW